ncbi:MAG: hypothetical protein ACYC8S_00270 [Minisyncoccota bacterium]
MRTLRTARIEALYRELAATFLARETNHTSLITVTNCILAPNLSTATILFTVLPEEKSVAAEAFVIRRMGAFREYVMDHARLKRVPFFSARIDHGDKVRRMIDDIPAGT